MGLINWKDEKPSWMPEPEPEFSNELDYLEWVWRNPDKPDRLRYMAAKACADFHFPTLKATAQIKEKDLAAALDRARERAPRYGTNVIQLVEPKALPSAQHDPSELKPGAASAANGGQSSSGFRRRI
jgi:hypothetical protein